MSWTETMVLGGIYLYTGFLVVTGTAVSITIIGWIITGSVRLLGAFLYREPPVPRGQRYARRRTPYDRSPAPQATHSDVAPVRSRVESGSALEPSAQLHTVLEALRVSTAAIAESILPHQIDRLTLRCCHCGADKREILAYRNTNTPIRCVPATAEAAVVVQQPVVQPTHQRCERSIIID